MRLFYVLVILLMAFPPLLRAENSADKKHNVYPFSISLGGKVNNVPSDSTNSVNFQLGLPAARIDHLNGFGLNLMSGRFSGQLKGLSISGIHSVNKGGLFGMNIAGLLTYTQTRAEGALISGGLNILYGQMRGMQLSGISNFNIGKVKGVQISGLSNFNATDINGLQLSGLNNVVGGEVLGLQVSGFLNVSMNDLHGAQLGIVNYARRVCGAQIGIINTSGRTVTGLQLGMINYSYDTARVQVGLVNINPKTKVNGIIYGGSMTAIAFGIRFANKRTFSILSIGYPYDHKVADFSGALSYRYGLYKNLGKFRISADLGYSHINLVSDKENDAIPNTLWSVQARANLAFHTCRYFGIFVTGGYEYAARYGSFDCYRNKPIVEFGISLF
ncbi:MAG: LA_2272 family surface repeat-containing protein [Bacteroidales bacterium]